MPDFLIRAPQCPQKKPLIHVKSAPLPIDTVALIALPTTARPDKTLILTFTTCLTSTASTATLLNQIAAHTAHPPDHLRTFATRFYQPDFPVSLMPFVIKSWQFLPLTSFAHRSVSWIAGHYLQAETIRRQGQSYRFIGDFAVKAQRVHLEHATSMDSNRFHQTQRLAHFLTALAWQLDNHEPHTLPLPRVAEAPLSTKQLQQINKETYLAQALKGAALTQDEPPQFWIEDIRRDATFGHWF